MSLFRYFSLDNGLRVLAPGELMVTPPKYLNDPFECRPVIKCKDPRGFARRKIDEFMTPEFFESHKNILPVRTFEEYQSVLRRWDAALSELAVIGVVETDSHLQSRFQDLISEGWGVICFAADGLDQKMWAHYASSHQGLMIEFRQSHLLFSGPSFFPIQYSDDPVVLDASGPIAREDIELLLSRKRSQWSPEMESRLLVELVVTRVHDLPEGPRYFIPIAPEVIVSVTLGLRATAETQRRVIELLNAPHFQHAGIFKIGQNVEAGMLEREPI